MQELATHYLLEDFNDFGYDLPKGTELCLYIGHTYGIITSEGVAMSLVGQKTPFFEVPHTILKEIKS